MKTGFVRRVGDKDSFIFFKHKMVIVYEQIRGDFYNTGYVISKRSYEQVCLVLILKNDSL